MDLAVRTGIFFHYQKGERLRDFPEALKEILCKDNFFLKELKAAADQTLKGIFKRIA